MTAPRNDLLLLAGKALTLLMQTALALAAAAVVFALFGVVFFNGSIDAELRAEFGSGIAAMPTPSVLGLLALALLFVTALIVFLGKLRGIIASVAHGDPFVPANAARLTVMAWLMLGAYFLGGAAALVSRQVLDWARQFENIDVAGAVGFDFGSLLLIITLFILARVFRHGAEMREDLEGTV